LHEKKVQLKVKVISKPKTQFKREEILNSINYKTKQRQETA